MSSYDELKEMTIPNSRKKLVEELIENLESGYIPWHKTWSHGKCAYNAVTEKAYQGINLISIAMRPFSDPRWCTYKQAQDKGWQVKNGSKGTPIEVYKCIDQRTKKETSWPQIIDEIKDLPYDEQQSFLRENIRSFIRNYYIFNAEQIEGIPAMEFTLTPDDSIGKNIKIESLIASSEAPIFFNGNGRNFYVPSTDEIHLTDRSTFKSQEDFYAVALHEIGHSSGHSKRLNRDLSGAFGTPSYAKEELRAELGSMFIHQDLGLGLSDELKKNHAAYIQNWISLLKEKPSELFNAISDANKIAKYVCNRQSSSDVKKVNSVKDFILHENIVKDSDGHVRMNAFIGESSNHIKLINTDLLAKSYGFANPQRAKENACRVLQHQQEKSQRAFKTRSANNQNEK